MAKKKPRSRRKLLDIISRLDQWNIRRGKLIPPPGRPRSEKGLFRVVAEKIPFKCLADVQKDMKKRRLPSEGIYLAHDSMGAVRYAGRGKIFSRLKASKKKQPLELHYFSLYVIPNKAHEREVETLVIRATSHMLSFNERKKRPTIDAGSIADYEAGTWFYSRRKSKKRGKDDA